MSIESEEYYRLAAEELRRMSPDARGVIRVLLEGMILKPSLRSVETIRRVLTMIDEAENGNL